jgi:hypothetical protein
MSGWFGIPWWVYGVLSLGLALLWTVVWPANRLWPDASPLRRFFLRWGHALTWYLLSAHFFVRELAPTASVLSNALALAGLAAYAGFLAASLIYR